MKSLMAFTSSAQTSSFLDRVVYVGFNAVSAESSMKMASEVSASILSSKADENIIFFGNSKSGGRSRTNNSRTSRSHGCAIARGLQMKMLFSSVNVNARHSVHIFVFICM